MDEMDEETIEVQVSLFIICITIIDKQSLAIQSLNNAN